MKIYLAARFGRRAELLNYKTSLEVHSHVVTSRWLTQPDQDDIHQRNYSEEQRLQFAINDYADVLVAHALIAFTEPRDRDTPGGKRGGRHVELGIALALHKEVFVVGYRENVFCHLSSVRFFETFHQLLEAL